MDITKISEVAFKIKTKTGVAIVDISGPTLESLDGERSKTFKTPGEYEVSGISAIGIKTDEGPIFVYEADSLRICHLGNVTKKLSDNKVSAVGDIDILFVPVTTESIELIQQIESYYVIPYGYKTEEELEKFLKESGHAVQRLPKFSVKKDDIVEDQPLEIIVVSK